MGCGCMGIMAEVTTIRHMIQQPPQQQQELTLASRQGIWKAKPTTRTDLV